MPAARWSSALAGALATACLFAAPALADICGNPGYSYAGVLSAKRTAGVSAVITAPVAPTVESGNVSGWVGVGRAAVPGKRGMLRAGLLAGADGHIRIYYEMRRPTGWIRHLGPAVQAGESHRLRVARVPNHKKRWKIVIDGRFVNSFRMSNQPRKFRAMATAESWDGGTSVCNRFHYSFGAVRVKKHGHWQRLASPAVIEDPGYAVVQQPVARFVAANVDDVPPAEPGRFTGNWETGDSSQWTANQWNRAAPLSEQFAVETNVVREGTYAAKFTVRPRGQVREHIRRTQRGLLGWLGRERRPGLLVFVVDPLPDGLDRAGRLGYLHPVARRLPGDHAADRVQRQGGLRRRPGQHGPAQLLPDHGNRPLHPSVAGHPQQGPLERLRGAHSLVQWKRRGHHRLASGRGETSYTKVLHATGFPRSRSDLMASPRATTSSSASTARRTRRSAPLYQDGFKRWISADPPSELGPPS